MIDKVYKIGYWVFLITVSAFALLFAATLIPIPGHIEIKIVQSGSMEPTISTGSLVVIRPVDTYNLGDIITFGPDTKTQVPITHRIVEKNGNGAATHYTTKGDANNDVDPRTIRKADVIGKTLFSIPYLGYLLDFAKKPLGFVILICIPAAVVLYDEVMRIMVEVKKQPSVEADMEKHNDVAGA